MQSLIINLKRTLVTLNPNRDRKLYRSGYEKNKENAHFFSTHLVAAMYCSGKSTHFYEYTLKKDIKLISISDSDTSFLDYLLTIYDVCDIEDKIRIRNFLFVFGYKLDILFDKLSPELKTIDGIIFENYKRYFTQMANKLIGRSKIIYLTTNYLDYSLAGPIYYRFSIDSFDKKVFEEIFKIKVDDYQKIISSYHGFHIGQLNSGFINTSFYMTLYEQFPEEIYVINSNDVLVESNSIVYKSLLNESTLTHMFAIEKNETFFNLLTNEDINKSRLLYFYLFTAVFNLLYDILNICKSTVDKEMKNIIERQLEKEKTRSKSIEARKEVTETNKMYSDINIKLFNRLFNKDSSINAIQELLIECAYVIDTMLTIDSNLLDVSKLRGTNPFYTSVDGAGAGALGGAGAGAAEYKLNGNLFTYTILSTPIKQSIAGLTKVYALYYNMIRNEKEKGLGAGAALGGAGAGAGAGVTPYLVTRSISVLWRHYMVFYLVFS